MKPYKNHMMGVIRKAIKKRKLFPSDDSMRRPFKRLYLKLAVTQ
jgi:hypothetical protein